MRSMYGYVKFEVDWSLVIYMNYIYSDSDCFLC